MRNIFDTNKPDEKNIIRVGFMKNRINALIKHYNISGREFSRRIGQSEGFANSIKSTIGANVLNNIVDEFPEVNLYWLVTGKGDMIKKEEAKEYSFDAMEFIKQQGQIIHSQQRTIEELIKKFPENIAGAV